MDFKGGVDMGMGVVCFPDDAREHKYALLITVCKASGPIHCKGWDSR